jgi:hypothetical protein
MRDRGQSLRIPPQEVGKRNSTPHVTWKAIGHDTVHCVCGTEFARGLNCYRAAGLDAGLLE